MSVRVKGSDTFIRIRWIPRYTPLERYLHWGHTATFGALTLTGMVLFFTFLGPLARGEAGQFMRLVHRVTAVLFALVPVSYAIFQPRRLISTLKDLKFGRDDIQWFKGAIPYYLLGKHVDMPPQGRWNTGEKLNALILTAGTVIFVVTGGLMWFGKGVLPVWVFRTSVIIHDITMFATVSMFLVHFFLAVAHPMMWASLVSMRFGVTSEAYAREHHAKWYYGEERAKRMYEEQKTKAMQAAKSQGQVH
jgi:formate dehydrogenase subunit gamma